MSEALPASELPRILRDLLVQVEGESAWHAALQDVLDPQSGSRGHLAVMHEPYLSLILDGRKTVESRFSQKQVAPYRRVRRGDLVLFKLLGGPVTAVARVADAAFYVLDSATWGQLRERFEAELAAQGETFWEDRRRARYASLIRLGEIKPIAPIAVAKRDRRGWVVLDSLGSRVHPDQLDLIVADDEPATQPPADAPRPPHKQMWLGFQ